MPHRAKIIGANLKIDSSTKDGTTVLVRIQKDQFLNEDSGDFHAESKDAQNSDRRRPPYLLFGDDSADQQ
jgi:hypothetical protein